MRKLKNKMKIIRITNQGKIIRLTAKKTVIGFIIMFGIFWLEI
ncbi:MAG: hypothetical protein ACP5JK_00470 [Candidatus Aenigmatarchaeota archaeon]